jgi:NodT family efflux transporter outer membrane factor (OMF) lipoprotein
MAAALAGACSLLAACASPAPERRLPALVQSLPAAYGAAVPPSSDAAQSAGRDRWWRQIFDDPALDALIDRSLQANPDLAVARARVVEAQAVLQQARGALWPQLSAQLSASGQNARPGAAGTATAPAAGGGDRARIESYGAAAVASYELDLRGGAFAAGRAAEAALNATRAELSGTRLAVLATTIEAYLDMTYLRQAIRLAEQRVRALAERVQSTRSRYQRGLTSSFELYAVQAQYRNAAIELPALELALAEARNALVLVLGDYEAHLDALLSTPLRPRLTLDAPAADAPARLLVQRPDVLAAAERLEAARQEVGANRAALFPQLSLSAAIGTGGMAADDLFDLSNWYTLLAADLLQPIFDGGRRRAEVQAARARYAAAAQEFGTVTLRAFGEVRTAYTAFAQRERRLRFAAQQLEEATLSQAQQSQRYAAGLIEYDAWLDARLDTLAAELTQAEAARDLSGARLAIHRALGGAPRAPADGLLDVDALVDGALAPPQERDGARGGR